MTEHTNPGVVPFEQARQIVEQHASRVATVQLETVELDCSCGRVLAEDIKADRDQPPFPRSTRDGYAVRAADVARVPVQLKVVGEVRAGGQMAGSVAAGQAAEIMTGAPVPAGADAVVMVEHTARSADKVEVYRFVEGGENVVPRGAEARQGEPVLPRGTRLNPAGVAVAASVGLVRVPVYARPRVAVLSTGDELVDVALQPGPAQIRNSNTYSLAAQIVSAGGDPVLLPVARDNHNDLRGLIEQGLRSDLLLLTGGVSMGKYDLVEQVLEELGAEFFFTGVLIQPGKPVVFGRVAAGSRATYFFGLPGNPVSTMVTFTLFARIMLDALAGAATQPLAFVQARLKSGIRTRTGLTRFLPARLDGPFERSEVELLPWHGSGDIASTARANCYIVIPPDRENIAAGEMVSILFPE